MGVKNIKDLKSGMVLTGEIRDCRGRLLIDKGTVLTDKYLKLCKMWGVVEAEVEGISSDDIYALCHGCQQFRCGTYHGRRGNHPKTFLS